MYMMTTSISLSLNLWMISCILISTNSDLFNNTEICESNRSRSRSTASWEIVLKTSGNLFELLLSNGRFGGSENPVAIIYSVDMSHLTSQFQDVCLSLNVNVLFLSLQLADNSSFHEIERLSKVFEDKKLKSNTQVVLVVCDKCQWVGQFIQAVCSNISYKWTYLLHITEWMFLTRSSNLTVDLKSETMCFDFVTYITASGGNLWLSRKSRGFFFNSTRGQRNQLEKIWSVAELSHLFPDITRKRKSNLEGLHLPVAFFSPVPKRSIAIVRGNQTMYDGFSIATLDVLAKILGFTYSLVAVTDGGSYGFVNSDGTAIGSVGLVARREVAFCAIGLNRIDNRLQAIDFLDYPTEIGPFVIVYALPDTNVKMDATLVDIVSPKYYLYLLGPCVFMALIGGLTHMATKSCTVAAPSFITKQELGRLGSFPDHIFFQSNKKYVGQTGRVLRASWALFFVIFSAAYSAYLVTTFTVKPQELKIDSFETLLKQSNYHFGVECTLVSLITLFKTSHGGELEKMWKRLVYSNKTNPWTFSCNVTEHMLKVLEGGYAFLPSYEIDTALKELGNGAPFSTVRSYPTASSYGLGRNYLSLPYDVFYKDELNAAMLDLEETGVFLFLRQRYGIDDYSSVKVKAIKSQEAVPLSRISLLIFVTIGGVAVGILCLFIEVMLAKCIK